ncbi:MAG TPA: SDR family oxidoreductase [Dongiaceae bacterium]|nr:SDR family oxidoreductase [Dongiaceae bacterium]
MPDRAAHEQQLAGRIAVVTGASSGIGRATAALLAARGAKVLAVGRDETRLAKLAAESNVTTCIAALEKADACAGVASAARKLGPIGILVNCAGRGGYLDRPIWEQSSADWRATMAVNLDAPFELTKAAAQDIRKAGWGRVVMISSTAGEVGAPSMSPYCASKHGVIGLMRAVAQDLAPLGGTCNAVLPGWVRTEMAERDAEREAGRRNLTVDAIWAERAAANPAKRVLEPEDIAKVVGFLVSDEAAAVNGEAITVSSGSVW